MRQLTKSPCLDDLIWWVGGMGLGWRSDHSAVASLTLREAPPRSHRLADRHLITACLGRTNDCTSVQMMILGREKKKKPTVLAADKGHSKWSITTLATYPWRREEEVACSRRAAGTLIKNGPGWWNGGVTTQWNERWPLSRPHLGTSGLLKLLHQGVNAVIMCLWKTFRILSTPSALA